MTRLTCLFLLAASALATDLLPFNDEGFTVPIEAMCQRRELLDADGGASELLLLQVGTGQLQASPRRSWASIGRSTVNAFQVGLSQRLLSRASFFRAGSSGGASNDDFALVGTMIICILIGVACLGCILAEATTNEAWDRETSYDRFGRDKKPVMSQHESPARTPPLRDRHPDRTASLNFVGSSPPMDQPGMMASSSSPPRSPPQQTVSLNAQSFQPGPSGAARSNLQVPSGAAKVRPGVDNEGWPQAGHSPIPTSSMPRRQSNTLSSLGSVASDDDDRASKPKPLCNALVLNVQSRFRVPFLALDTEKGTVPILADSSNKILLMASIEMAPANNSGIVSLSLTEGHALLGSIQSIGGGHMNITDRRGAVYGEFQYAGNLDYRLSTGGIPVATLRYERAANALGHVNLVAMNGTELAHAVKCNDASKEGKPDEYLEVRVDKGMDSVLALLCVMGAMVLG